MVARTPRDELAAAKEAVGRAESACAEARAKLEAAAATTAERYYTIATFPVHRGNRRAIREWCRRNGIPFSREGLALIEHVDEVLSTLLSKHRAPIARAAPANDDDSEVAALGLRRAGGAKCAI